MGKIYTHTHSVSIYISDTHSNQRQSMKIKKGTNSCVESSRRSLRVEKRWKGGQKPTFFFFFFVRLPPPLLRSDDDESSLLTPLQPPLRRSARPHLSLRVFLPDKFFFSSSLQIMSSLLSFPTLCIFLHYKAQLCRPLGLASFEFESKLSGQMGEGNKISAVPCPSSFIHQNKSTCQFPIQVVIIYFFSPSPL